MKYRALSAFVAVALASVVYSQDPSAKVTYSTVAVPASRALDEISKVAGVALKAAPQTESEILVIRVKDAPLPEVMQKIAMVTSGEWQEKGGVQWLVASSTVRTQQIREEQAAYAEKLTASLKKYFESLQKNPTLDSKAADKLVGGGGDSEDGTGDAATMGRFGMFGGASGPSQRAIVRLLQGIGINTLTAIPKDARVVFSSNPTRMQRPFGPNSNAALNALVQEQNVYAAAAKRAKATAPPQNDEQSKAIKKMMDMFGGGDDEDQPINSPPSKAILIVSRQPLFGGLNIEIKVFDTNGKKLLGGTLPIMGMDFTRFAKPAKETKEEPAPKDDKPIVLSKTTQEIQSFFGSMAMPGAVGKTMSPELTERLTRPDLYDPLSFAESEALVAASAAKGEQLVANLPDSLVSLMNMIAPGSTATVHTFLSGLRQNEEVKVDEKDGWMTVLPAKPVESREHRLDRPALATLIRAVKDKEFPALDDIAAYSLKNESPTDAQISMTYMMLYAPSAMQQGFGGMVSWDMMRLYGTLGQGQRQSLIQGGTIQFGNLSEQQKGLLSRLLFGPDTDLAVESEKPPKEAFEMPAMLRRMFGGSRGDYRSEPTEIMPNGLPSQGIIRLAVTTSKVAKVADSKAGRSMLSGAPLGSDELALFKFFREDPNMSQIAGMMPSIEDLKLGTRTTYEFKFFVAPDVAMTQSLSDNLMPKDAATVKLNNLPADFQKEIADKVAQFKKMPFFDPSILMGSKRNVPPL